MGMRMEDLVPFNSVLSGKSLGASSVGALDSSHPFAFAALAQTLHELDAHQQSLRLQFFQNKLEKLVLSVAHNLIPVAFVFNLS